jgi:glycosyltransferase involved in cell wall biosynthesis
MSAVEQLSVGVVMPLHNGARYVAEAVASALEAGGTALKRVVVVDDGSDDDGLAIAVGSSDIVEGVCIAHAGVSAARNRGVAMLDTDLIAFLDHDDLWPKDSLINRVAFLSAHPQADGVYGRVEQFVCPTVPDERRRQLKFENLDKPSPMITALLLRRSSFLKVGLFRPEVGNAENLEWYLRARAAGLDLVPLDRVVLRRRIHGGNSTVRNRDLGLEYVRVLRSHLRSRRGSP